MRYRAFFAHAFGKDESRDFGPFEYQRQLAESPWPDLLNVPTGMGKTAGVILAWLWKRGWRMGSRKEPADSQTPRRLIFCLPMRVLVEQTHEVVSEWLKHLDVAGNAGDRRVSAHVLMGGSNDLKSWAEHPDEDMILIGTQDMFLSRALMRGYGMTRYAWPIHFALLHNDAMWVFDEVQLMGAGLTTSAQLEAFRRSFPLACASRSLWLSATLNPAWLATVDMKPHVETLRHQGISDTDRQQAGERLRAVKRVAPAPFKLLKASGSKEGHDAYLDALRDFILKMHDTSTQTLVIVNRVDRAQGLFRRLRERRPAGRDLLVHARFRSAERAAQTRRLRDGADTDRIVIATQAIEAGVDISSKVLITELAPWSSLVQRFGRCNRYGEHNEQGGARIFWVDLEESPDTALPYRTEELLSAREKVATLRSATPDALPPTDEQQPPTSVPRRKDLLDLFNTDPDLSGFDVDVSDYIRDSGSPGLQVFWREFEAPDPSPLEEEPSREELCPISIGQAKGLQKRNARYWDSLDGKWRRLDRDPRPGMTLMLRASDGGYDPEIGFDPTNKRRVPVVQTATEASPEEALRDDPQSRQRCPVLLADHLRHVAEHAAKLCEAVNETTSANSVIRAGRWHDVGKAHEVFQKTMHRCDQAPPGLLAKSPCDGHHSRRYFRHELASMLAWIDQHGDEPNADLIAYLIASHHGKVRMSVRAMPTESAASEVKRFARGVWEGDVLPELAFDGEHSNETELRLGLMELGEGEQGSSWTVRTLKLLEQHGPFYLAWLETLVRLADWRASASEQEQLGDSGV